MPRGPAAAGELKYELTDNNDNLADFRYIYEDFLRQSVTENTSDIFRIFRTCDGKLIFPTWSNYSKCLSPI